MYTTEEFTRIEALMKEQSDVLQLITQGKPLDMVLARLTTWLEANSTDGLKAAISCTNKKNTQLYYCAGSLPRAYIEATNGINIGPAEASSGTAAYTLQPVFVTDIEKSQLWIKYKDAALQNNLRACWSTPLITNNGNIRGTLDAYYPVAKPPAINDLQLVTLVAHTALLAIEYNLTEEERNRTKEREKQIAENILKSEQRFQNLVRESNIGIIVLRGEEMIVDVVNDMYGKLIDRTPEELLNKPLFQRNSGSGSALQSHT